MPLEHLAADASLAEITAVIDRDGAVVLDGLLAPALRDRLNGELDAGAGGSLLLRAERHRGDQFRLRVEPAHRDTLDPCALLRGEVELRDA